MKLGKGVRFICIKDINEINQSDDMLEQYKNNIINAVQKEIGRCHYKVSGFESDDIGGMSMREFYGTLAKVFIQINEKFEMKYLHTSSALNMRFEFFGFDDMKKMTQSGRLLSGKSIDPKAYQDKKETLEGIAINFFPEKGGATNNETLKKYIKTLKDERELLFKYEDCLFDISWSYANNGWSITGYEEVDNEEVKSDYILKDHLCGLCTGSERDAVLFFIQDQDHEIEQQRKMFFQIVEKANINIVTCGDCGLVVFHQIEREGDICCPHCSLESDSSDFPDFYC